MIESAYNFEIELRGADDRVLARRPPQSLDFGPAEETARWAAFETGGWSLERAYGTSARFEPDWEAPGGAPFLSGFRVVLRESGGTEFERSIPARYFRTAAAGVASDLVAEGLLQEGDGYAAHPAAYYRPGPEPSADNRRFQLAPATPELSLEIGDAPRPIREPDGLMPAVISQEVVEQMVAQTRAATSQGEGRETGGVLVGRLMRDRESDRIYLEITAQVPAQAAEEELTALRFTDRTWQGVRAALALRDQSGEIVCGWFHSHPVRAWSCKNCPVERQRACPLARFFSSADVNVHRTAFSRAYQIALLVSDVPFRDDPVVDAYGWVDGEVAAREFTIRGDDPFRYRAADLAEAQPTKSEEAVCRTQ